jgi:hypothetical protein
MSSEPHTQDELRVLNYLQERDLEVNPTGYKAPSFVPIEDILRHLQIPTTMPSGELTRLCITLKDLERQGLLVLQKHPESGTLFVRFHEAVVEIQGHFCIDPDLVCERCGQVMSSSCAMGVCI